MDPTARDEAVRRLRDESGRRLERHGRRRTVSSWCALAAMAAGISFLALDARVEQQRAQEADRRAEITGRLRAQETAKRTAEEAVRRAREEMAAQTQRRQRLRVALSDAARSREVRFTAA